MRDASGMYRREDGNDGAKSGKHGSRGGQKWDGQRLGTEVKRAEGSMKEGGTDVERMEGGMDVGVTSLCLILSSL